MADVSLVRSFVSGIGPAISEIEGMGIRLLTYIKLMRLLRISVKTMITPVSYTHLDVYKRQTLDPARSLVFSPTGLSPSSVCLPIHFG